MRGTWHNSADAVFAFAAIEPVAVAVAAGEMPSSGGCALAVVATAAAAGGRGERETAAGESGGMPWYPKRVPIVRSLARALRYMSPRAQQAKVSEAVGAATLAIRTCTRKEEG